MEPAAEPVTFANTAATVAGQEGARLPAALEQEIRAIYGRSPLYSARFPLHSEPLQWSCYREIPVLTKQEIVQRGHTAFFDDYASAMVNSGLPETDEFAAKQGALLEGPPGFLDLDVLEDRV